VSLHLFLGAIFLGMVAGTPQAGAQSAAQTVTLGPSGLPLPRFVSLKASRVNSRIGPGLNYSVDWMYTKAGLPMEIVQEYDTWRKVRDSDGSEGWVNQTLLSGKRTALVTPWQSDKSDHIKLLGDPQKDAPVVAILEPGVMGAIKTCNGQWCEMTFGDHTGWIRQSQIWGAYPGEKFKD
jgi:SH3-like domain-containing protein